MAASALLRSVVVTALTAAALVGAGTGATASSVPTGGGALIDNGVIQLGVNAEGHLNLGGGTPSSGEGTSVVGLRYLPTNAESTAPGCLCEGWGAADALSGATGYANISSDGGAVNLTPLGFSTGVDPSGAGFAISEVRIGSTLEVTHDYHESVTPNLYEATVTIRNISGVTVEPRYRRVMDWDVEPTAFDELVTIQGTSTNLLFSSNDGFETADPLGSRGGTPGPFVDLGPDDHGALFDFGFDPLAPGASVIFNIYYGAGADEIEAEQAVDFVGANVWSFGQPTVDAPQEGAPNTFIFAFSVGGGSAERLNVRKRADDGRSDPGDPNGYSIVLANPTAGPMVVTSVTDLLPAGFAYAAGSSTLDGVPIGEPNQTTVDGRPQLQWPGSFTIGPLSIRTLHFGVVVGEGLAHGVYTDRATATALNAGGAAVPVRATGDAAPVEIPPPTVVHAPAASSSTGTVTVDPHDGTFDVSMRSGARSDLTITTGVTCPDGSAPAAVDLLYGGTTYPMALAGGLWSATIPAAAIVESPLVVRADCGTTIDNVIGEVVLFDPSGIVSDARTGAPVVGATVTLFRVPFAQPDVAGERRACRTVDTRSGPTWDGEPAADPTTGVLADPRLDPPEMDPLVNPQVTNAEGRYGWDVAAGCWFVRVEAPGYVTRYSAVVGVPPAVTDLDLALTRVGDAPPPGDDGGGTPPASGGGTSGGGGSAEEDDLTVLAALDRIGTSVALSQDTFADADADAKAIDVPAPAGAVVLASADDFADGLVAAPLAVAAVAPVLLTRANALDPRVEAEIDRVLDPGGTVLLVGGTAAIGPVVEAGLRSAGYAVTRVAGDDRYATSVAVARRLGPAPVVLETTGDDFPDALAAGAAAHAAGGPVLLTAGSTIPPVVADYLAELGDVERFAIGGPAGRADPGATVVAGADRYATAVAVAARFFDEPVAVGIASGEVFPDALAGGAHIALRDGPLLLVRRADLPAVTAAYLADNAASITEVFVYGGVGTISSPVRTAVAAAS